MSIFREVYENFSSRVNISEPVATCLDVCVCFQANS